MPHAFRSRRFFESRQRQQRSFPLRPLPAKAIRRTLHFRRYAQDAMIAYLGERTDSNLCPVRFPQPQPQNARLTITSVHNVVKKAVRAMGLHDSLSAHDFRHYRATQLLRAGMSLEVVQGVSGHADVTTTRNIYAPVLVQVVTEWLTIWT
ncbi:MAG: site-specific integrase [Chloroflexota bacterium]